MMLRTLTLTAFITIILSCNSITSNQTTLIKNITAKKDSNTKNKPQSVIQKNILKQYANIVRIHQQGDTTFLDADYIQYLIGDDAIEAAKREHQADTFQISDGKIHIDVPNDYFIVNESKKIRQLPLEKDCVFDLIINPDRIHPISDNSLESLQKIYRDSPFILILNDKGLVVKIEELFLP